jgi:hypothetical protein
MSNKRLMFVVLALAGGIMFFGAGASTARAVTRWVNVNRPPGTPPTGTSCTKPGFVSIQQAVTASLPGDTINVCPGTYTEQVIVPPGKDNLTIQSVTLLAAVIQAPPTVQFDFVNSKSIVRITTSRNVTLLGFTITGPGPGPCDSLRFGVRVDGGGSANIIRNHITEIRDTPLSGCQNGVAILVGRRLEGQVGSAYIVENLIDKYQKNGPTVDNVGSSAVIVGNTIVGAGSTPVIAQNGIQVSSGANAEVASNRVTDNVYGLAPATYSTGIILFEAGSATRVSKNIAKRNDDNVDVHTTSGSRISDNRLTNAVVFDGIFMDFDTSNNRITDNFLRRNREHDCHDDSMGAGTAGTANFWINNNGRTQNRPGLCTERRGGDDDRDDDDDDHGDKDDHGHAGEGKSSGSNSNAAALAPTTAAPKSRPSPFN